MIYKSYLKRNCMLALPLTIISAIVMFCIFLFGITNVTNAIIQLKNYNKCGYGEIGIASAMQSDKNVFAYSAKIHVSLTLQHNINLEYLLPQTFVEVSMVEYNNTPNLIDKNFEKQTHKKLKKDECSVSNDFAIANHIKKGDKLVVEYLSKVKTISVSSIFSANFGLMHFDPRNTNGLIVFGEDDEYFSDTLDDTFVHFGTDESIIYNSVVSVLQLKQEVWSILGLNLAILTVSTIILFFITELVFERKKTANYKIFLQMGLSRKRLRLLAFLEMLIKFSIVIAGAFIGFQLVNVFWICYFLINLTMLMAIFAISFIVIYLFKIIKDRGIFL